jgi:DEAD/DEAH box helicase domain-containing protein
MTAGKTAKQPGPTGLSHGPVGYHQAQKGAKMYQPTINAAKAEALKPGKMTTFELLMRYLDMDESEKLFEAQARAYSLSLLEPLKATDSLAFVDWNDLVGKVNDHIHFTEDTFTQPGTFFGTWIPRSSDNHFYAYAGILVANMKKDKKAPVSICAVLDDRKDSRTVKYEEEWNGF